VWGGIGWGMALGLALLSLFLWRRLITANKWVKSDGKGAVRYIRSRVGALHKAPEDRSHKEQREDGRLSFVNPITEVRRKRSHLPTNRESR